VCISPVLPSKAEDIWDAVPQSDDPKVKKNAVDNSFDCPSGRLVVVDKNTE